MSNFIKQIEFDGQSYDFSFNKIQTIQGPKYFVMVAEADREYHFIIEKSSGEWMLNDAPKVPEWIHNLERELIGAIEERERE